MSPSRGILVSNSPPTSRSSTPGKAARKLRFAEVTANDVHVYPSEPSSPKRPLALLPPPPEANGDDNSIIKLDASNYKGFRLRALPLESPELQAESNEPEEGTPEDIRRRFFPGASPGDPSLEWIERTDSLEQESDIEPRFDLHGSVIPLSQRYSLPTHLGLHHHGGSASAGYTLADLLFLSRSAVSAQRATILSVLAKLIRRLARNEPEVAEVKNVDEVRIKALNAGLSALQEKGSLGIIAIDLVWACIVFWDEDKVGQIEGLEIRHLIMPMIRAPDDPTSEESLLNPDLLSTLPYAVLLPELSSLLESRNLPQESLTQLLSVLHRFSRHSIDIAIKISVTPRLVGNIVNVFRLIPTPPSEDGPLPNPDAINFLRVLASANREIARSLEGPADSLLGFIATAVPLSASPFPIALAERLLCETLDLYTTLSKYGIYSGIATTAAEQFSKLSLFILSESDISPQLTKSFLSLLKVWLVCARDPHRTTPTHDLLWSQVTGWGWGEDLLSFRKKLLSGGGTAQKDPNVWSSVWGAVAAWLAGCRVNSVKNGREEVHRVVREIGEAWSYSISENGPERSIITKVIASFRQELDADSLRPESRDFDERSRVFAKIAALSDILVDFTGLVLSCAPQGLELNGSASNNCGTHLNGGKPSWLRDAYDLLSQVSQKLIFSPVWDMEANVIEGDLYNKLQVRHMRSASTFLALYIKLSRAMISEDEWIPLAAATVQRLLPGDEGTALWIVEQMLIVEKSRSALGDRTILLLPFFANMIRPDREFSITPLVLDPESIQKCTTQVLPSDYRPGTGTRHARVGLPVERTWPCIALDHLLRSGTSPVLTDPNSVPDSWNASEVDLAQTSLSLLGSIQRRLVGSSYSAFALRPDDVIFTCMKIFMLEHNQQQSDSSEEVFRDPLIDKLVRDLLLPFQYSSMRGSNTQTFVAPSSSYDLECASRGFLGPGVPFHQFYTDFLALYDAVSFSHPTFARLLLPPTSMRYALDYRKGLWDDFGHVLRSVQSAPEDVLLTDAEGMDAYFWPYETDAEMVGWYLRALIKWPLVGFVRVLAVHHVACNIWPDLQDGNSGPPRERRARMLVQALVSQAKPDVVKDVVTYVQARRGEGVILPPECYKIREDRKNMRSMLLKEWHDEKLVCVLESIYAD